MTRRNFLKSSDYPDLYSPESDNWLTEMDDVGPHQWTRPPSRFLDWLAWRVLHFVPAQRFLEVIARLRNARCQRDWARKEVIKLRARVAELEAGRGYR